jgi:hypothetical protein
MMLLYNENIINPSIYLLLKIIIMKNIVSINLLFVILFFNIVTVFGQFTNNHIIYNPHQNSNPAVGRTMGGAAVALSDSVPNLLDNPASLGQNQQFRIFWSITAAQGFLSPKENTNWNLETQRWSNVSDFGICSVYLPIRIFQRHVTFAATYNTNIPYDYKIREDVLSSNFEYSGRLKTFAIGIGSQLSSKIKIGFGWSNWFGKREIVSWPQMRVTDLTTKTSQNNGNLFNMRIHADISNKFSVGTSVYFPFQLKINHEENTPYDNTANYEQKQNFNGAIRVGFAYNFSNSLNAGLEYGYQHKFITHSFFDWDTTHTEYSNMHSIAAGLEYIFSINNKSLPPYIMYRVNKLPVKPKDEFLDFNLDMLAPQFEKKAVFQIIEVGGNYNWSRFPLFLAAQWKQTGKYKHYPPPIT